MAEQITNTEGLRNFYNDVYAKGDIHDNVKLYRWIVRLLKPQAGKVPPQREKKLLDIACGIGLLLKAGEDAGLKTSGLDISDEAVKHAKRNSPESEVVAGDGENLPWPEGSFDYVTSLGSLEHYLGPEKGIYNGDTQGPFRRRDRHNHAPEHLPVRRDNQSDVHRAEFRAMAGRRAPCRKGSVEGDA